MAAGKLNRVRLTPADWTLRFWTASWGHEIISRLRNWRLIKPSCPMSSWFWMHSKPLEPRWGRTMRPTDVLDGQPLGCLSAPKGSYTFKNVVEAAQRCAVWSRCWHFCTGHCLFDATFALYSWRWIHFARREIYIPNARKGKRLKPPPSIFVWGMCRCVCIMWGICGTPDTYIIQYLSYKYRIPFFSAWSQRIAPLWPFQVFMFVSSQICVLSPYESRHTISNWQFAKTIC